MPLTGCRIGGTYIGPDGEDKNHGQAKSLIKGRGTSDLFVAVVVLEKGGIGSAVLRSNGVVELVEALELGPGHLDDVAVLDEEHAEFVRLVSGNDAIEELGWIVSRGINGRHSYNRRFTDTYVNFLVVSTPEAPWP
jgi:hypothetical protein